MNPLFDLLESSTLHNISSCRSRAIDQTEIRRQQVESKLMTADYLRQVTAALIEVVVNAVAQVWQSNRIAFTSFHLKIKRFTGEELEQESQK